MSQRAHFWLRVIGLTAILATQFAPRLWNAATAGSQPSRIAVAAEIRQP
jgi:hypothetical protein